MMKPYGLVLIKNVISEGSGEPVLQGHDAHLLKVFKWMKTKAQTI